MKTFGRMALAFRFGISVAHFTAIAFLLSTVMAGAMQAAPFTWDASGAAPLDDGGGAWNPTGGTNWFDGASTYDAWGNTTSDTAIFGVGSGVAGAITVGTVNANAITFNAPGSGNYTLSSGTITLGGTTPTITVASTLSPTISSTITGTSGLVKSGSGTLTLSNASTNVTTPIVISQGILKLTTDLTAQSAITIGDANSAATNPTLEMTAAQSYSSLAVGTGVTGAKVLMNNNGNNFYTFDTITLNNALTVAKPNNGGIWAGFQSNTQITGGTTAGTDALVFENLGGIQAYWQTNNSASANNFTGNVRIKGEWRIQAGTGVPANNRIVPDASTVTIDSGGQFLWTTSAFTETIDGLSGSGTLGNNNSGSAVLTINANNTANNANRLFSGTFGAGGASSVTLGGTETQEFSGANITYTGNTNLNNGTLKITRPNGNTNWGSAVVIGGSNSPKLQLNAAAGGDTWTFAKVISGGSVTASVEKIGSGTVVLSQANTYTGATSVQNGNLQLTSGTNRLPTGTTVTLGNGANNGKFILGNGSAAVSQTISGLLTSGSGTTNAVVGGNTANSTLTLNIASSNSYGGLLGGAGTNENKLALVKSGAGTLTLSGANTYTGGTTLSTGTLVANHASAMGASASDLTLGDANTGANPLTFKIDTGVAGTVTLNSVITTNFGTSQTLILNSGSALGVNVNALASTINLAGSVPLAIQATNTGGHGTAQDWTGQIIGTGVATGSTALTLDGTSAALRLTFGGTSGTSANTFTGDVIIKGPVTTQGTTFSGAVAARQNLGFLNNNVNVQSGTWTIVWGGETVQKLDGAGNIALSNQNALNNVGLTVGNGNVTGGSYAGAISGGFGVAKVGTGTQTFSGASTYTGTTTVTGGKLLVSNTVSTTSGVGTGDLVINGGTLGGSGYLGLAGNSTNVTFGASGGTIAPGDSPGILTINGGVDFTTAGTATFAVELNGLTAGTNYDQLVVNSATGGGSINLANATLSVALGFTPLLGNQFTIINNTFSSGGLSGNFSSLTNNSTFVVDTTTFRINYDGGTGNDVVLTVVPEPGTFAMLLFGSVMFWLVGRKRTA